MNETIQVNNVTFLGFLNSKRKILLEEYKKMKGLQSLLTDDNIRTFFQPIVSLKEGNTIGYEILNRPQKTALFPTTEKFYDYVGRSGHVFKIERFLRHLAIERYSELSLDSKVREKQLVFLNIQPQVLADPQYQCGKTLELLAKHHLSPNQIVFELTEKESVLDYNQFERIIEHYRQQGYRIAVDDAGTGYNSLKTLMFLKPEFLKIDLCLIQNIDQHPTQQHLVKLLFDFAVKSGTQVIAEGIETMSELRYLQKLGIHLGQGYALGKPKPALIKGKLPLTKPNIRKSSI